MKLTIVRMVVGGAFALLAFFASVSVTDAKSNLAGWAAEFGIDRIPNALATPTGDAVVGVLSIIAAFVAFRLHRLISRAGLEPHEE